MKTKAFKKPQTTNKAGSLVKKSPVQKSIVKNKSVQNKQKKSKDAEANVSIKEKLSGKIFSPTVEKSKNVQQKKVVQKSLIVKLKSSPDKKKIPPAQTKKKTNKRKLEVNEEKTVLPVKKNSKNAKNNIKKEEEVTSEIKNKTKVIAPKVEKTLNVKKDKVEKTVNVKKDKVEKTVGAKKDTLELTVECKKDKVEVKAITGTKRKLKSEKSKLQIKKTKITEEVVKLESGSSPVIKSEDQNTVAKPRKSKAKRKSSVTSIKDLKPISNIRSLVKRPVKKISKSQIKKKLANFPERGVCYFSHIPHGFYEKELKKYCSQFGEVTGVYHPVSKSGNSRGYAFVEFKHKEVAEVVADAMNNYLMFNRLLKCQYIPPEAQRPWVFKQERNNMKAAALRRRENLQMQMRSLSKEEVKKWKKRRLMKVKSLHKKLNKLGVDYEFQVNDANEHAVQQEKKDESDKQ